MIRLLRALLALVLPHRREPARSAASVCAWKGGVFLYPRFVRGALARASGPVERIAQEASDRELGAALQRALQASAKLRRATEDDVLTAIGGRSWSTLEREAKVVEVAMDQGRIELTPMQHWVSRTEDERGMRGEQSHQVEASCSMESLGAALRRLLA